MIFVEFIIEDAPEWVKEDKCAINNSLLVNGVGEPVIS